MWAGNSETFDGIQLASPVADRYRQPATVEQPSDERFDVVAVGIGDKLGECGRTTVEGLEDAPLLTGESGEFLVARRVQEYPARRRDEARCAVAQAEPGPGGVGESGQRKPSGRCADAVCACVHTRS
ncbi:hypothetical protein MAB47J26_13412 [Mycobacteroides abscessus 47J26]|nr:hypothetical protein MAB47J26_13412 [Mycobacteroides abscessus 47J26]